MISVDTNILLYAYNLDSPEQERAYRFLCDLSPREDVLICDLVLVELYILLRNPAVIEHPLTAGEATEVCRSYRRHPKWRLVENAPVMETVWELAGHHEFPRRRIFDARIALTLLHHGTTELATANTKDFQTFSFQRIWNPLLEQA